MRYSICPVIKDPRNDGIARNQFLAIMRKPDGSPLEPQFVADFNSLQATVSRRRRLACESDLAKSMPS